MRLDVKSEFDNIAVFHLVFFALDAEFADITGGGFGSGCDEVIVGDDLRGDKASLKVTVDNTSSGRGFVAVVDGPGASFFFATGDISTKA